MCTPACLVAIAHDMPTKEASRYTTYNCYLYLSLLTHIPVLIPMRHMLHQLSLVLAVATAGVCRSQP